MVTDPVVLPAPVLVTGINPRNLQNLHHLGIKRHLKIPVEVIGDPDPEVVLDILDHIQKTEEKIDHIQEINTSIDHIINLDRIQKVIPLDITLDHHQMIHIQDIQDQNHLLVVLNNQCL